MINIGLITVPLGTATYVMNITDVAWNGWMENPPSYVEFKKYEKTITKEMRKLPNFDFKKTKMKIYRRSPDIMKAISHVNDIVADLLQIRNPRYGSDYTLSFSYEGDAD